LDPIFGTEIAKQKKRSKSKSFEKGKNLTMKEELPPAPTNCPKIFFEEQFFIE
jgi:hypothetical protein